MQSVLAGIEVAGFADKLVLKNIHDRMNTEGFEVRNARGARWTTYGDNALRASVETQRLAALAVFLSRMQIVQARAGRSVNPDDVLALLPVEETIEVATDRAISYIPDAVRNVPTVINSNMAMLRSKSLPWYAGGPILPYLGAGLIGNISSPDRARQLELLQQQSERTRSGPLLAPQIRLLEW
jgi:hypothetical protein